jgi:uncharacterized protein (TIGR03382 family)
MSLEITALTRKTAIVDIFRQCGAGTPGSPVLLTVLMVAWSQLGLRNDDLSTGLNEMLEDGSLSLDADPRNPAVALTENGLNWVRTLDPKVRLDQERILRSVQQRLQGRPVEKLAPGQEPRWRIIDRRLQID